MPPDNRPSTEERERLSSTDTRPEDKTVLTRPNGAANGGYAYHEANEDGQPLCNAGNPDTEFEEVTISEAKRRNKSPCQMCIRIID